MTVRAVCTIAQVLYPSEQAFDFARIVADLHRVLSRRQEAEVAIVWDCDDLVSFDLADGRVLVAVAELDRPGSALCLTLACGPAQPGAAEADPLDLCRHLVAAVQTRSAATEVVWREMGGPLEADALDRMLGLLPPPRVPLRLPAVDRIVDRIGDRVADADRTRRRGQLGQEPRLLAAPPPPLAHEDTGPRAASTAQRLTAHCFNATLILLWLPLGAALMVLALVRGEDLRLSGRLMAVAGTLFAMARSPLGHAVKVMTGV